MHPVFDEVLCRAARLRADQRRLIEGVAIMEWAVKRLESEGFAPALEAMPDGSVGLQVDFGVGQKSVVLAEGGGTSFATAPWTPDDDAAFAELWAKFRALSPEERARAVDAMFSQTVKRMPA